MGKSRDKSEFRLEGRFLGYVFKDGYKIKSLKLATADATFSIKVTKESRKRLERSLLPGDWIQVVGTQKLDPETNGVKMKALSIHLSMATTAEMMTAPRPAQAQPGKMSVLYCQKSSCMKRGGKAACQALSQALDDRGLSEQVTVKGTGCMKACSKGPNFVFPGKARYTKVDAKDIPALVDEHFPQPTDVQPAPTPVEYEVALPVEAEVIPKAQPMEVVTV
jgi:NADH:ubiquinone oxidoreductase subunit E